MYITIITASYNAERTIKETIESVRLIKDDDVEYIIVDGGSKDRTIDIIKNHLDVVDQFISEKDNGIYDAINKGISMANGKYTLFLAADDLILKNSVRQFKDTVREDTEVWCGSIIYQNEYGCFWEHSSSNLELLKHECSLRHPASFFRKDSFGKYGMYDTAYKCSGDREIFLRFYLLGAKFQIERVPIELFSLGGISTSAPLKLPVEEGILIEKKYNIKHNEKINSRIKLKLLVKKVGLVSALMRLFYFEPLYRLYISVSGAERKKLTAEDKLRYLGEH